MPLHDVDLLKCHALLDDAGVRSVVDGHPVPLVDRIERLIAERDELRSKQSPTSHREDQS